MNWNAYFRLMRMDKPIGILLLWFPVVFALWIANHGHPPFKLVWYFMLGTIVMRSAGCIVNDLADRHIDRHVNRTAKRPVTTGEVTFQNAIGLFIALLFVAFYILTQLPIQCFQYAVIGLFITVLYPFCKRWIHAPQLILSLAFSVSIPMVYVASSVEFDDVTAWLIIINILWVVIYDTEYAMVDRDDDLKLGVQSTAILFGQYDRVIIAGLQVLMQLSWLFIVPQMQSGVIFYMGWGLGTLIFMVQSHLIAHRIPQHCFRAFQWNILYGVVMSLTIILSTHLINLKQLARLL